MHKGFLQTAALLGALAVVLGAFGAHGLKKMLPPETVTETITTFETGVRYQFYHVFALLAVAILFGSLPGKQLQYAGMCFIIGIVLFSGSLYAMTAFKAAKMEVPRLIGPITPLGGVFFIVGWVFLFLGVTRFKV